MPRPDLATVAPGTRGHSGELIRTVVSLAVLAVIVPLIVVDWARNAAATVNVLLAMTIVLFSAARLARMIGTGRPDMFRAFFYLFVYIFLGLATLGQVVSGQFPQDGRSYLDDTITEGLLLVMVGIAGYEIGWLIWRRRLVGRRERSPNAPLLSVAPASRWYFSRPRVVIVGLLSLGTATYQVAVNGITTFFTSRSETTSALTGADETLPAYMASDKAVGVITVFVTQVPLFVVLFLVLYCRHHKLWPAPRSLMADGLWRLFILLLLAGNIVINNPIGNARFWSCLVAVSLVSVYLNYTRPAAIRGYVVLALSMLLLVLTALDAFRYTDETDLSLSGPGTSLVTDPTYAMFQMTLNGILYVDDRGYTDGMQLAGSALCFVPRALWESKPIATGQMIDPPYARSATLWTELQVDFGVLGVLLLFVLLGAASVALTRRAATARPGVLHAIVPVVASFQLFLLRGSLLPAVGQMYQLIAVFVLIVGIHRLTRPPDDPLTPSDGIAHPAATGSPAPTRRETMAV